MNYFTRFNRDKHFIMLHLWYVLDKWVKDTGCQLTNTELELLKTAGEKIEDVNQRLFKRLDKEYSNKVIRDLETTVLVTARASQMPETLNCVNRKSTDLLGEMVISVCNNYMREGCIKYKKCPFYQALADAGVPTCVTESNACPYRNEKYEKKTKTWTQVVETPKLDRVCKQSLCESCGQVWNAYEKEQEYGFCPKCGNPLGEWR